MRVVWSDPAVADLDAIHEHIAEASPFYAAREVAKLIDAAKPLEEFPKLGRHLPESDDPDVRELLVGSFRLIYRLESDHLLIVAVIHGSQLLDAAAIEGREPREPN